MPTYEFFKKARKILLGQEEYKLLSDCDYAIAEKVSDCLMILIKYQDKQVAIKSVIGHLE